MEKKSFSHIAQQIEEVAGLIDVLLNVAPSRVPVLLLGPGSTGIDLLAQAIHASSPRSSRPFITTRTGLHPGAIFESQKTAHKSPRKHAYSRSNCIESANGGTLFIDQVQNTTPAIQLDLLRLINEQEYADSTTGTIHRADIRIVASAWTDLERRSKQARFRKDLFERLDTVVLEVRRGCSTKEWFFEAISLLRETIIAFDNSGETAITLELASEISRNSWSPVVVSLQHAIRDTLKSGANTQDLEAFFFSVLHTIGRRHTKDLAHQNLLTINAAVERCVDTYEFFGGNMYDTLVGQIQRALVQRAMIQCNGTLSRAAGILGMSINLLEAKLREFDLNADPSRTI